MSNSSSTPTPTSAQSVDSSTNANPPLPPLHNLKRKAAARSNVWEHFDKIKKEEGTNNDEPRCICKYCKQDYGCDSRNGTSSLWYHLKTTCRTSPLRDLKSQKLLSLVKEDKGSIMSWSFSKERSRLACTRMIIRDELPFSHVENVGFRDFMQEVQPKFDPPSRRTIARDVWNLFQLEKGKLKSVLSHPSHKVSITTDTVTSHQAFHQMCAIFVQLQKFCRSEDSLMKSVATSMKRKFDKYWGKVEDINKLLLIAIVLDPRYKIEYLLFSLSDIESNPSKVNELQNQVKDFLIHMYDVYKVADPLAAHGYNNSNLERIGDTVMVNDEDDVEAERLSKFMKLRQVMDVVEIRNEVDKYLLEPPENLRNPNFDLLAWWQENSPRFPIVSQIAKDVFGIPISTVASESAFSLGGRIVDPFRASLTPRMVEALVCTSDWLKAEEFSLYKDPTKEELEFYDALEKIETGRAEFPSSSTPELKHEEAPQVVPSSSSSSIPETLDFDVFLSFRGIDTRNSFTDHLYHGLDRKGIDTFMDEEKLERGKPIAPKLLKAIEHSKFAVVVLSADYASSTWCLDELAHIVQCMEDGRLEVFPVFYHIEPSEVGKQTGNFGKAFAKHEENFKQEKGKVKKWRRALRKVRKIAGWDLKNRKEAKVIEEITNKISNILNDKLSSSDNDLIGMDSRIKKMEEYLALCRSDDVRTIGIWGFGGIGKTTLANEVFKKIRNQFDAKCFVSSVREESTKVNGLVGMQKSLLATLLHCNEDIQNADLGIQLLRTRLRNKRVLIVLDDVDKLDQIKALADESWLGPGSRVIITTREKHELDTCGLLADSIYEVDKLKVGEDFQLFCRKAFKENDAPHDYKELSKKFVEYAGGIPLALEVLGSCLRVKNVTEWSEAFDRLDEDPEEDIMNVLKISFDALKGTTKQIFLDIACFFNGEDQVRVKRILESCRFYPRSGMRDLLDKALIKINERNELWMHDLLRKMGQDIVHRQFPNEPGKRSRLWINENAYKRNRSWHDKVLAENTGTTAVEGIFLSLLAKEEIQLDADPFTKMCNLRLLKICNVKFSRCPEYFSKELRLLEWHEYPLESLPSSFKPCQLVELKMPNSRITQLWHESCTTMENLVQMDLSYCQFLIKTPDFRNVPNLERLILEGCEKLSEVHATIGDLQHLVVLNMKGCESLESLPHSISLESLKTFNLSGCSKLKEFPEIVGNMEALSELYLDGTAIRKLPASIQQLKGLILLNLNGCKNLTGFPMAICSLTSLRYLSISGCSRIDILPENLGSLEQLEELDACKTAITEMPGSILLLPKLKRLCFRGNKDVPVKSSVSTKHKDELAESSVSTEHKDELGESIVSTEHKDELGESSVSIDQKDELAESSVSTEYKDELTESSVSIEHKDELVELPLSSLGRIRIRQNLGIRGNAGSVLQFLDLSENSFVSLPESISQLSKLRELSLFRCRKLQSLPKLPLSIKFIDVRHCPKLPTSKNLTVWTASSGFSFMICGNSDEDEERTRHPLAVHEELGDELFFSKYIEDRIYHEKPFEIRAHFPHSTRVPNWCRHWMSGSSVRAKLPIDTEGSNSRCMGFALFVAFEILENEKFQKSWELEKTVCHFSTREGRLETPIVFQNFEDYRVGSSYGLCCYEPRGGQFARQLNEGGRQFEASVTTNRPDLEVKGCGIHFIRQQDVADFVNNLIPIANHRQHPGFELWSTLESSGAEMVLVYDRSMGTSMNFPL